MSAEFESEIGHMIARPFAPLNPSFLIPRGALLPDRPTTKANPSTVTQLPGTEVN